MATVIAGDAIMTVHSHPRDSSVERIIVMRALQLGDLLCAVPALRALRAAHPRATITLVGLPWANAFVQRFSGYLDEFIEFPGYPGLPERDPDIRRFPRFLAEMHARDADLAIQMHGSGSIVNPITMLFGARQTAGYYQPGEYCPDPATFLPYPWDEPEVRCHVRLMEFLGCPAQGERLEFPLTRADEREFDALPEAARLAPGSYVCIHPGARYRSRRWPVERFAAVGDALSSTGLHVVLTGSADEYALTASVARSMRAPSLDLAGRTTLGALAVLLSRARLLVCNDTGVSHVAAGLGTPSVVIASGSDVARWAPLDRQRHRVLWKDEPCRPCGHVDCPVAGHPCAVGVTPEAVRAEAESLLRQDGIATSA